MDRALIDRYEAGAEVVKKGIAGLSAAELNAPPAKGAPGKWTIQQVVHHLLDSDLVSTERMKRIISEEKPPLLIAYDENAFVANLPYDKMDVHAAVEVLDKNRRLMTTILRGLPASAFEKFGVHNERGKVTLAEVVAMYVNHIDHHMKFVEGKRKAMGR